jgi:hypothetical protein
MISNIIYVNSSKFDYSLAINPDCGPEYAGDLGLPHVTLDSCDWSLHETLYVIDPRLTPQELAFVEARVQANQRICLAIRFVDPYFPDLQSWEKGGGAGLRTALRLSSRRNTGIISAYWPSEMVECLRETYGEDRLHVSPYPYNTAKEVDVPHVDRKKQVLISGSNSTGFYPLRTFARRKRRLSWKWRGLSAELPHPGYPDLTGKPPNGLVGRAYLEYLARFEMLLVCPGRSMLEFMKYRECAYANCCPVGQAPREFPLELAALVLPFSWVDFNEATRAIQRIDVSELRLRAADYRAGLRRLRSPEVLRQELFHWANRLESL